VESSEEEEEEYINDSHLNFYWKMNENDRHFLRTTLGINKENEGNIYGKFSNVKFYTGLYCLRIVLRIYNDWNGYFDDVL
jgi:hypothetical protein